jgi:hypothetical protein
VIGKGGGKGYSGWLVPRNLFRAGVFAVGSVLGWGAGDAPAQVFYACPAGAEPLFQLLLTRTSCPFVASPQVTDEPPVLSPGRAFFYSALLPGLGQRKLGKGRWLAYVAVEGAAWIAWGNARWSATNTRREYQDLAWDVPRSFNGPRIDGDFSYYETMQKFLTSGVFDTDPGAPGIQPEMDLSTFNGQAWSLVTEIHFPPGLNPLPGDPEYDAALADYQSRAYDERFEWSWAGQSAAWDEYMDLIDSSDGSFRRASQFLGLVIANHLLSGVDAFVTSRIQRSGRTQTEVQMRVVSPVDRKGFGLVLQVRH